MLLPVKPRNIGSQCVKKKNPMALSGSQSDPRSLRITDTIGRLFPHINKTTGLSDRKPLCNLTFIIISKPLKLSSFKSICVTFHAFRYIHRKEYKESPLSN